MTFRVYWTNGGEALKKDFTPDELGPTLKFMERLRKNPDNVFVTMVSQNPNSVGKPGVAEVDKDYNWTKRRNNERPITGTDAIEFPIDE